MNKLDNLDQKIKKVFPEESVLKIKENYGVFEGKNLPSFIKDWLIKRFTDEEDKLDRDSLLEFIDKFIPQKGSEKRFKGSIMYDRKPQKVLTRIMIEPDIKKGIFRFAIPDLGINFNEGIVREYLLEEHSELKGGEVWGVFTLSYLPKDVAGEAFIELVDYKPFKPYEIDLDYFREGRKDFEIEEWVDLLIRSMEYNPSGFYSLEQKLLFISRLLVFIEPRLNMIELAPKGTGKSYIFNNLSKYGWCVSGGKVTRAKMFYDMSKNTFGFITKYDFVALDEIQTIEFSNDEEMRGALKNYLEFGKFTIANVIGQSNAGLILLGNISLDEDMQPVNKNYFSELPEVFQESALFDRFHGFLEGWNLPRIREDMKVRGYTLNVEYFSEVLHALRECTEYFAIVEDLIETPPKADTRDTTAVKRIATGYLKLLFPHVRKVEDIDRKDFEMSCLKPAIEKREIIRKQLHMIDPEYKEEMPDIKMR
jgi:ATP-dependent Lon protease